MQENNERRARAVMAAKLGMDVQELLTANSSLSLISDGRKIRCSLSGHEIPCRADSIRGYIQGKKYQRLLARQQLELDKFDDLLVPSNKKHHEHQVFCKLTLRHLNNQPHHIKRHIDGKRFQKAYRRWLECQKTGEPFKPRQGQKRPRRESTEDEKSEDEKSEDSMSDLYPAEDFPDMYVGDMEEEEEEQEEEEQQIFESEPVRPKTLKSKSSKSEAGSSAVTRKKHCKNEKTISKTGGRRKKKVK